MLLLAGCVTAAQPQAAQPQAASRPLPTSVQAPRDTRYPGVIDLHVDASDVLRRIYQIEETIPVSGPGPRTLLFPQWTPGDDAPNEPLEKMAGLIVEASGRRLVWSRDTVDVQVFHVLVPRNTAKIEVRYQYLGSTGPSTGPVLITPTMLDLQWQSVVLYPSGHFLRNLVYRPTVTLPASWTFLTSMEGAVSKAEAGHTTVTFPEISLEELIDQPVMAGKYLQRVTLSESPVPVRLDVAADSPDELAGLPEAAKEFQLFMPAAYRLFGGVHFNHYDHMLFLSDEIETYFEP